MNLSTSHESTPEEPTCHESTCPESTYLRCIHTSQKSVATRRVQSHGRLRYSAKDPQSAQLGSTRLPQLPQRPETKESPESGSKWSQQTLKVQELVSPATPPPAMSAISHAPTYLRNSYFLSGLATKVRSFGWPLKTLQAKQV